MRWLLVCLLLGCSRTTLAVDDTDDADVIDEDDADAIVADDTIADDAAVEDIASDVPFVSVCSKLHIVDGPRMLFWRGARPRATFRSTGSLDVVANINGTLAGLAFDTKQGTLQQTDSKTLLPSAAGAEIGPGDGFLGMIVHASTMRFRRYGGAFPPPTMFSRSAEGVVDDKAQNDLPLGVAYYGKRWYTTWANDSGSIRRAVIAEVAADGTILTAPRDAISVATGAVALTSFAEGVAWAGATSDESFTVAFAKRIDSPSFVTFAAPGRAYAAPAITSLERDVALAWRSGPEVRVARVSPAGARLSGARIPADGAPSSTSLGSALLVAVAGPGGLRVVVVEDPGITAALEVPNAEFGVMETSLASDGTYAALVWRQYVSNDEPMVMGALLSCQ